MSLFVNSEKYLFIFFIFKRNSYQAVIVTDVTNSLTFVIFNYERIEWAASTEFGGDSFYGLSNTNAAKVWILY